MDSSNPSKMPLCASEQLLEGALAIDFDVIYGGQTCRAFAFRFHREPHAYLNRCAHIAMEMDARENHFFDPTGQNILCSSHGALYEPQTGRCISGPCRGGLVKIMLSESDGTVFWHPAYNLRPLT
jgi:nitrite reductase/ring-hydroxylating ferredoxin subunit